MIAAFTVGAQIKITGVVLDKSTQEPMIGATISVAGSKDIAAVTGIDGHFSVTVPNGAVVTISYIGYKTLVEEAHDGVYLIESQSNALNEVVVTAQESQQLSTSSVIGRQAMDHLQPSSFGDMMELIPGGRAQDPHSMNYSWAADGEIDPAGSPTASAYGLTRRGGSCTQVAARCTVTKRDFNDVEMNGGASEDMSFRLILK